MEFDSLSVGVLGFCILQLTKNITGNKLKLLIKIHFCIVLCMKDDFNLEKNLLIFVIGALLQGRDSKDFNDWKKSIEHLSVDMKTTNRSYSEVYKEFLVDDAVRHPFGLQDSF